MSTKAQVIGEILKIDTKPFKPRHIYEEVGISRQLMNQYLTQFLEKGIISNVSHGTYQVINKEALIDEMVRGEDRTTINLPKDTVLMKFNRLGMFIDWTASLRALNDERASGMVRVLNEEIDAAMEELKTAKKFLNRKTYTPTRAQKVVQPDIDVVWQMFGNRLGFYYTKEDFIK